MSKNSVLIFAVFIIITLGFRAGSAQITIKIPKLPKTEKTKQEQTKSDDNASTQTETTSAKSQPPPASLGSERIYKKLSDLAQPALGVLKKEKS